MTSFGASSSSSSGRSAGFDWSSGSGVDFTVGWAVFFAFSTSFVGDGSGDFAEVCGDRPARDFAAYGESTDLEAVASLD